MRYEQKKRCNMPIKKETAQTRYAQKCKTYAIKYYPAEKSDSDRLQKYISDVGISANSYIKTLIKNDLDQKNVPYPEKDD